MMSLYPQPRFPINTGIITDHINARQSAVGNKENRNGGNGDEIAVKIIKKMRAKTSLRADYLTVDHLTALIQWYVQRTLTNI